MTEPNEYQTLAKTYIRLCQLKEQVDMLILSKEIYPAKSNIVNSILNIMATINTAIDVCVEHIFSGETNDKEPDSS